MRTIQKTILAMLAASACAGAVAQSAPVAVDIKPQGMRTALRALGEQAGLQILFRAEDVEKGKLAPAVKGRLTGREALEKLLANTELKYEFVNDKTVRIAPVVSLTTTANTDLYRASLHVAQNDPPTQSGPQSSTEAQASPDKESKGALQEIVVTGTHIRGLENRTSPIVTITREDIDRAGYSTVQQLLQSLPQDASGGLNGLAEDGILGAGALSGANDSSATGVNLRGLGPSATLVLLDGHRLAKSAGGTTVDVSLLPLSAIERVEVMTDGSSAVYGSDAVAGVVNFITRRDYEGAETRARFGSVTNGERNEELITQLFGHRWSGGNALFNLQYQHFDALSAADRDFSEETLAPTDLLPRSRQYAAMLSGRQSLGSSLEVYGNATFVDKETSRNYTDIRETRHSTSATRQYGLDVGGSIGLMRDWRMSVDGLYSKEKTDFDKVTFPAVPSCVNGTTCSKQNYEVKAVELKMDGSLLSLPAGDVKAALGASYRDEDYLAFFPADDLRQRFLSKVKAGFAEVAVPILNGDSGVSLAQALTLSAAVRHDDYNEFGSTTNPRYGISWVPMTGLNVRAAYSTSFRAPSPIERVATTFAPILASLQFSSPEGGTTPALVVIYNGAPLKPETAHNTTVGFDFTPSSVADLQVSLDYFRIDFRNRISTPPFDTGALLRPEVFGPLIQPLADDAAVQSFVAAFVADGGQFLDFSGGIVGARNVVNFQQQNAARVQQHGFDFNLSKGFEVGSGRIVAHLAATYIDEILTSFTAQSVATDIVNTYANPLKLRARADLSWSQGPWQLFGAVNYADKHTDTSAIPYGSIDAWTTVDLNATYEPRFARGLSVSLMAENVLDEPPPFAVGMGLDGIHYDVGNASPLGRFLGIELRKTW